MERGSGSEDAIHLTTMFSLSQECHVHTSFISSETVPHDLELISRSHLTSAHGSFFSNMFSIIKLTITYGLSQSISGQTEPTEPLKKHRTDQRSLEP